MPAIAKKPVKRITVFVATLFLAAVFQAFVSAGTVSAAPAAGIYLVDMSFLVANHPDSAAVGQAIRDAAVAAEQEFAAKSANMDDRDKEILYRQLRSQIDAQGLARTAEIYAKVQAVVEAYAIEKGLPLVVEKSATIIGGEDITAEVGKKLVGR